MRFLYVMLAFVLLLAPLRAEEVDNAVITIPTGWTVEKGQYQSEWLMKSVLEQQASVNALAQRMDNVIAMLPQDVYDAEEGKHVGYCVRLQEAYDQLVASPGAVNYAEMAYLLDQAEAFVAYVERERNLPLNAPDTPYDEGSINAPSSFRDEIGRQGIGWLDGFVDGSYIDHWTPRIATYNNSVWVGATDDAVYDTFMIWHSTDAGQNWTLWHNSGIAGPADRWLFDLSVDAESTILYSTYMYTNEDIWLRRWLDLANSGTSSIHTIENTADDCTQPVLSVEHIYFGHRLCCMYYNSTTDQLVIKQSTDFGATWATTHTTTWTTAQWPRIKGASGAASQTTDCFYFVAQKSANTLTVFESVSGLAGSWIETDYTHTADLEDVDIAASHNYNTMSTVVSFGYPWSSTDLNVRVLFRPNRTGAFISQLVDGDGAMTRTPVIACDAEYVDGNNTGPDYYHLAYYKHQNAADSLYYPFALRCLNDSASLDNFVKTNSIYHEKVAGVTIDTLASQYQGGRPAAFYQIDITTNYNAINSQYFPHIAWMRYYTSYGDADPRTNYPDQSVGVAGSTVVQVAPMAVELAPNPLHGVGRLTYVLTEGSMVSVSLYDATGRVVRMLVNEQQTAGEHTVPLVSNGLAAGVYFVRVATDNETGSSMMIVVK